MTTPKAIKVGAKCRGGNCGEPYGELCDVCSGTYTTLSLSPDDWIHFMHEGKPTYGKVVRYDIGKVAYTETHAVLIDNILEVRSKPVEVVGIDLNANDNCTLYPLPQGTCAGCVSYKLDEFTPKMICDNHKSPYYCCEVPDDGTCDKFQPAKESEG